MATSNTQNIVAPVLKTKDGEKGYLVVVNGKGKFFNVATLKEKGKDAKKVAQAYYDAAVEAATPAKPEKESKRQPRGEKAEVKVVEKESKRQPRGEKAEVKTIEKESKRQPRGDKAEKTEVKTVKAKRSFSVAKGISFVTHRDGSIARWRAIDRKSGLNISKSVKRHDSEEAFLDVVEAYLDKVGPVEFKQEHEDDLPMAIAKIRKELKATKDEIRFSA